MSAIEIYTSEVINVFPILFETLQKLQYLYLIYSKLHSVCPYMCVEICDSMFNEGIAASATKLLGLGHWGKKSL